MKFTITFLITLSSLFFINEDSIHTETFPNKMVIAMAQSAFEETKYENDTLKLRYLSCSTGDNIKFILEVYVDFKIIDKVLAEKTYSKPQGALRRAVYSIREVAGGYSLKYNKDDFIGQLKTHNYLDIKAQINKEGDFKGMIVSDIIFKSASYESSYNNVEYIDL